MVARPEDRYGVRAGRVVRERPTIGWPVVFGIMTGWTLFSIYIYSRYSQLGDAAAYIAGGYDDGSSESSFSEGRTLMLVLIARTLRSLLGNDLLVHLCFSLFVASGVYYLLKQGDIRGRARWPVLALLVNPNFGVWTSVTGRESLFVGLLGFFMGAVLGHYRQGGGGRVLLAALCAIGMIYVRAPFGAGIALFYLVYLVQAWGPRLRMSAGVKAVLLALVAVIGLLVAWPYMDAYITTDVLPTARSYFTINSATTRTWVHLETTGDLLSVLWWALPLSLIGPTPGEVFARPLMLPFLLAGLVVFCLYLHAIYRTLSAPSRGTGKDILVLGWLPASLVILVSYVPFGIYNPGSGIRYASCFLLFLILPPLLLAAEPVPKGAAGRMASPQHGRGHGGTLRAAVPSP